MVMVMAKELSTVPKAKLVLYYERYHTILQVRDVQPIKSISHYDSLIVLCESQL
jgi:hypothetical protein